MRMLTFLRAVALLSIPSGAIYAGDFLPLETGNSWEYRRAGGRDSFKIQVGLPALIGGNTYYRLAGYVDQDLWVRRDESNGALYYRDEEGERDILLTSFELAGGAWFDAPFRFCTDWGQVENSRYEGPVGRFNAALAIRYRGITCADAGLDHEVYVDNVGMVRRSIITIAGPVAYELVHARVGSATYAERPSVAFRLTLTHPAPADPRLIATLRLTVEGGAPLKLVFPTSQDYDVILRDADGQTLWRWSEGRAFLQVVREVRVDRELAFEVEVPLGDPGQPPSPGIYNVEAWLASGLSQREFSASASVEITSESVEIKSEPQRSAPAFGGPPKSPAKYRLESARKAI